MTYVNHFSKFCILRPLTSKRAEEVASNLLDIFLTFGAPGILQSDNGREFVISVIAELSNLWPELKLVTGRPRHPQSQGAVERLNGVIQDKLAIWMRENKSRRWSVGIKFIQWQINISLYETTGQSPYKVTFGEDPNVGLGSSFLPKTVLEKNTTEEDLEDFLETCEQGSDDETSRAPMECEGVDDEATRAPMECEVSRNVEETEKGNDMEGSERRSLGEVDIDQSVAATGDTNEEHEGRDLAFREIRHAADRGQEKLAARMTRQQNDFCDL